MTACTCSIRYNVSFRFPDRDADSVPSDVARAIKSMFEGSSEGFTDVRVWAVINGKSEEVAD